MADPPERNGTPQSSANLDPHYYNRVLTYLEQVKVTTLDQFGRFEYSAKKKSILQGLLLTIPWPYMILQFLWSSAIVALGYYVGNTGKSTLSRAFWDTRLQISSNMIFGVGWALFVLLGFFISAASSRYYESQKNIANIGYQLQRISRSLFQVYTRGIWHEKDYERIISHLIAYPIALKMMLRSERDASQLDQILHPDDVKDVLKAPNMHIECSRVTRAYFSKAEFNAIFTKDKELKKKIGGFGTRYFNMTMMDSVDDLSTACMRILNFQPSLGYINHLRIFFYIWMSFLPLALVRDSGWFTVLWALLITYGVSMIFTIGKALNEPFGFDVHDIKLNDLCIGIAKQVLEISCKSKLRHADLIDKNHSTPSWLSDTAPQLHYPFHQDSPTASTSKGGLFVRILRKFTHMRSIQILVLLFLFTLWSAFIIFLTWGLSRDTERGDSRWWSIYVPLTSNTTSFVSVGLFLLVSFWVNDAYGRYWRGLQLWQTAVLPNIEVFAVTIGVQNNEGTWHDRDRERLFSHLSAIPYVAKMVLRDRLDGAELTGMLSAKDIEAIMNSPDPLFHVFSTIFAYINSADFALQSVTNLEKTPYFASMINITDALWNVEMALDECMSIKGFPISVAFSVHLRIFIGIWLSLIPLSMVLFHGVTSFVYLIPIAYSIINIPIIGDELCDPFGEDPNDIPLDQFSKEMAESVHRIYQQMLNRPEVIRPKVHYNRQDFQPTLGNKVFHPRQPASNVDEGPRHLSAKILIKRVTDFLPTVSKLAMTAVILWTVAAVFISWGLSKLWDDARNEGNRHGWNSPVQVDNSFTGSVGFALFLMLTYAASNGIGRYDDAAKTLHEIEMHLRAVAAHVVKTVWDNSYHKYDKERMIAHLVQIPLSLRNILLDTESTNLYTDGEGLLCEEDRKKFESSASPLDYLINTVHAYAVAQEIPMTSNEEVMDHPIKNSTVGSISSFQGRFKSIRVAIRKAFFVKRFQLVGSYKTHLRIFVTIWLLILPFSMTGEAGFFTILWVPLIAYGILGMMEIADQLVDPLGNDAIDIPVDELCTRTANKILEVVNSARWSLDYHIEGSGFKLNNRDLWKYLETDDEPTSQVLGDGIRIKFNDNKSFKQTHNDATNRPSFLAHVVHSVPWWKLLCVTAWSAIACALSFAIRRRQFDDQVNWWVSIIGIHTSVPQLMSTATFVLLGFYVSAAYQRYFRAASLWTEELRAVCHDLVRGFRVATYDGTIHEGEHDRIIGHIASIPIVLKNELRGSADLHDIQSFLAHEDIGRIECSESMTNHCCDVLRSYLARVVHKDPADSSDGFSPTAAVSLMLMNELFALERLILEANFLNEFPISQGFLNLLNVLLLIWFAIVPFALTEVSGWFTVLWISIIGYSILGIHSIATEIQNPFGSDLNDLDLDTLADKIVVDVLQVRNKFNNNIDSLLVQRSIPRVWRTDGESKSSDQSSKSNNYVQEEDDLGKANNNPSTTLQTKKIENGSHSFTQIVLEQISSIKNCIKLGLHVLNWWVVLVYLLWLGFAVSLNYVVDRYWPFPASEELGNNCPLWFCSKIAIGPSTMSYIGFALFLLLSFQLFNSHQRYVEAIDVWQESMLHTMSILSNRVLDSWHTSKCHEGDIQRIIGHIAAYPICLMGTLRNIDYKEKLLEVLSEEDVDDILSSTDREDHCVDVIWSYTFKIGKIIFSGKHGCLTTLFQQIKMWELGRALRASALPCREILSVPTPYGYVQHLRIFIGIYLMLLPFGLVDSSGWVAILWCLLIGYGTYGIERWASELHDPFGTDLSDIPLEEVTDSLISVVKNHFEKFKSTLHSVELRVDPLIVRDRITSDQE